MSISLSHHPILIRPFVDDAKRRTALEVCKVIHDAAGWMIILNFVVAETILLARSWIIWGKSRRAAVVFIAICALGLAVAIGIETKFNRTLKYNITEDSAPKTALRCPSISGSPIIVVNIAVVMYSEIFFLITALVKGIRDYQFRVARSARSLTYVLYRDGILFFVYAFAASLVNLIAIVTLPRQAADVLVILQMVLHSSLTARIILNLRQAGNDSVNLPEWVSGNELTTIYHPRTCDRHDSNALEWETPSRSSVP